MAPTSLLVTQGEEERRERAGLQALRERIVRQERHGARPAALPLQGVRPQLHGDATPAPSATPSSGIVQIDEMWHFVNGKKTRFGSGRPTTLWQGEPWPGSWVGVMMRPASDSSTGSASRVTSS